MSRETTTITLKSSDDETFEVEEAVAIKSQTIQHMIEDDCIENGIPLPNVTSKILAMVIEYCKRHVEAEAAAAVISNQSVPSDNVDKDKEDLNKFDAEFVKLDQKTLFDLILAANYLNIKSLLDLTCQTVANMIKGKSITVIREHFHIINDYAPAEEDEVRRENAWAFE